MPMEALERDMDTMGRLSDTVDRAIFRSGMSRLGSAVSVVTTTHGTERFGFTASAVCSVSDTPPTLLVCINRSASCFPAFERSRHFCVNTLMPGHEEIADVFGGRILTDDRFGFGSWSTGQNGMPMLTDASVSFECELTSAIDEATHRILFGRVTGIRENAREAALLYFMRRYLHV